MKGSGRERIGTARSLLFTSLSLTRSLWAAMRWLKSLRLRRRAAQTVDGVRSDRLAHVAFLAASAF